ncbi:MAG: hypothetical protein JNM70_11870 [Anaerolineae bacterium]|nr:hypothetical protein [Anaerolineae bacterium]
MAQNIKPTPEAHPNDRWAGGIVLIGIGVLVLVVNLVKSDTLAMLVLPLLGIAFLAWAFFSRRFPLVIPGSILLGLGVGVVLAWQMTTTTDEPKGGVVVLGLAAGFLAIALLAPLFEKVRAWWALIPAAILAVVGVPLLMGDQGIRFLEVVGQWWPLILVAVGLYVLFVPRRGQKN